MLPTAACLALLFANAHSWIVSFRTMQVPLKYENRTMGKNVSESAAYAVRFLSFRHAKLTQVLPEGNQSQRKTPSNRYERLTEIPAVQ